MARIYGYENRKWWYFILFLNMAAAKGHDPEAYELLYDLVIILFHQDEDKNHYRSLLD